MLKFFETAAKIRMQKALDVCANNIMLADDKGIIVYVNDSLAAMLAENESEIRKALPEFSARAVIGSNFDLFHRNPEHQRSLIQRLTSAHRVNISVASLTFRLIASPLMDDGGQRIGTVVEWSDRTAEAAAEKAAFENVAIRAALECCSTNVMIADAEGIITYMNRSLREMLARHETDLRKEIPAFDSRSLVGKNFDAFHRSPAHQRNLIAGLRTTHRAEIRIGPCAFLVLANPITDDRG